MDARHLLGTPAAEEAWTDRQGRSSGMDDLNHGSPSDTVFNLRLSSTKRPLPSLFHTGLQKATSSGKHCRVFITSKVALSFVNGVCLHHPYTTTAKSIQRRERNKINKKKCITIMFPIQSNIPTTSLSILPRKSRQTYVPQMPTHSTTYYCQPCDK